MALTQAAMNRLAEDAQELRRLIVQTITRGKSGHVGPALSSADIITCLYDQIMKYDPTNPHWEDRDRFILSAGHKCVALFAMLAMRGFFPKERLDTYLQPDSLLGGHTMKGLPGVEVATGSLGHGLSIAVGMALAARIQKKSYRVYVLLGDGELAEGSNWEAAMTAGHYGLTNLVAIVDRNTLQCDGRTEQVMEIEPLAAKWESFGWGVQTVNGHSHEQLCDALEVTPIISGKPTAIIARTIKGKGVSFMEDRLEWHYRATTEKEAAVAFAELSKSGEGGA